MFLMDISKPCNVLNTAIIVKGPNYPQVILLYIQQLAKAMSLIQCTMFQNIVCILESLNHNKRLKWFS